jgi:amidase
MGMFGVRSRWWVPASCALILALFGAGASPVLAQAEDPEFEVFEADILRLQDAMESGVVTSASLVDAYMARIRAFDQSGPALNAITYINPRAHLEAEALDEERARQGPRGPLHGIPVLLKDNVDVLGMPTTAGSVALSGMMPPDDSWVVRRLREAGAVLLGKTNMDELAIGITTVSSVHGQTRNPYDLTRSPGGSSGGTGVAISAGFAALGYGTDTCGSIRIPAAYASLFALRPTKGLISSDGVVPRSHSLDTPGAMARSVTDLAIGMDAIVRRDLADAVPDILAVDPPRFADALRPDALKGIRVGVLQQYFTPELTMSEVSELVDELSGDSDGGQDLMTTVRQGADETRALGAVVWNALERMESLGATLVPLDIVDLDDLLGGQGVIDHEFKFDLQAYLAETPDAPVSSLDDILHRGLYHPSIEALLLQSNVPASVDSPEYQEALARMVELRAGLLRIFEQENLDAIAYPTMRRPAAELGRPQWGSTCRLSASSGFPAITMPAGLGPGESPVGLELLGTPMDDARLLAFAFGYEQATSPRIPPLSTPPLGPAIERGGAQAR